MLMARLDRISRIYIQYIKLWSHTIMLRKYSYNFSYLHNQITLLQCPSNVSIYLTSLEHLAWRCILGTYTWLTLYFGYT